MAGRGGFVSCIGTKAPPLFLTVTGKKKHFRKSAALASLYIASRFRVARNIPPYPCVVSLALEGPEKAAFTSAAEQEKRGRGKIPVLLLCSKIECGGELIRCGLHLPQVCFDVEIQGGACICVAQDFLNALDIRPLGKQQGSTAMP